MGPRLTGSGTADTETSLVFTYNLKKNLIRIINNNATVSYTKVC